jgi:uncharacterized SAM-binding protein YcdF (DUF218 family)
MDYPGNNAFAGCILILGAPNDKAGNLSVMAKLRLQQGYQMLLQHPDFKILLTGGFGNHFNETNYPHWQYAKDYLINELAVAPEAFLPEAIESSHTVDDLEKAKPVLQKYNFLKIILVTSQFHLPRVQYLAEIILADSKAKLAYAPSSDAGLNEELLLKLETHEEHALAYLKQNYR